jgi:SAM-dependent methyltransferase
MTPTGTDPTLVTQREAWERRPLVRDLYTSWYARIVAELSAQDGSTIELGCGIGSFKEFFPGAVATDVCETPWSEEVIDAQSLPWPDAVIANLVMVDVLHHLPDPMRFLREAARVLVPRGRLVMVEPFCSPVSRALYDAFHHEPVDMRADPFSGHMASSEDPWDANSALPTLIFWRGLERFREHHPELLVVTRERLAWLLYPLSGGFSRPRLAPYRLGRVLHGLEEALPLERLAAFRCLVTLEKRPQDSPRMS